MILEIAGGIVLAFLILSILPELLLAAFALVFFGFFVFLLWGNYYLAVTPEAEVSGFVQGLVFFADTLVAAWMLGVMIETWGEWGPELARLVPQRWRRSRLP